MIRLAHLAEQPAKCDIDEVKDDVKEFKQDCREFCDSVDEVTVFLGLSDLIRKISNPSNDKGDCMDKFYNHSPEEFDGFSESVQCTVLFSGFIEHLKTVNQSSTDAHGEMPDCFPELPKNTEEIQQSVGVSNAFEEMPDTACKCQRPVFRRAAEVNEPLPEWQCLFLERLPLDLCRVDVLVQLVPVLTKCRLLALHVPVVVVDEEKQRSDKQEHAGQWIRSQNERQPRKCRRRNLHTAWKALPHTPEGFSDIDNERQEMPPYVDNINKHPGGFLRPDAHVLYEHIVKTAELLTRL